MVKAIRALVALGIAASLCGLAFTNASAAVADDGDGYTPPVVNCAPGTVPGWLNEHGDPTSCVDNHPCIATATQDFDCNPIAPAIVAPPAAAPAAPVQSAHSAAPEPSAAPTAPQVTAAAPACVTRPPLLPCDRPADPHVSIWMLP